MNVSLPFHVFVQSAEPIELHPLGDDPSDFIVTSLYDVMGHFEQQGPVKLGEVLTQHILYGMALDEGMPWALVSGTDTDDVAEIFDIMCDATTEELHPDFAALTGGTYGDVYYVRNDEILDEQWGPHVLRIFLQHTSAAHVVVAVEGLIVPESEEEFIRAAVRSAKLQAMGFVRYYDSPYFFMSTLYGVPELPEHLALELPVPQEDLVD